jgi:hypothetical protein
LTGLRGIRLKDARSVRLLLSKLIKVNLNGTLTNDSLRAITTACNTILATFEKSEFEERLTALEVQIEQLKNKT